jgi:hypothetical protein
MTRPVTRVWGRAPPVEPSGGNAARLDPARGEARRLVSRSCPGGTDHGARRGRPGRPVPRCCVAPHIRAGRFGLVRCRGVRCGPGPGRRYWTPGSPYRMLGSSSIGKARGTHRGPGRSTGDAVAPRIHPRPPSSSPSGAGRTGAPVPPGWAPHLIPARRGECSIDGPAVAPVCSIPTNSLGYRGEARP